MTGQCHFCGAATNLYLGDPPRYVCMTHLAEWQHTVRADQFPRRKKVTAADAQFLGMTLSQLRDVLNDPPP